jgi:creatinine amidohydrolase
VARPESVPRLLGEMTWTDVAELLTATRTVILAAGSAEQHGPHLPILSDFYQGEEYLRRVVARLASEGTTVVGGFSLPYAPAEDSMSFAGTITISNRTYEALVSEILQSLHHHGFRRFPILVCHEQTFGPLMSVTREFNAQHQDAFAGTLTGWYQVKLPPPPEHSGGMEGHAGELETSRMLATRPDLVALERARTHHPARGEAIPFDHYPLAGGGRYVPPFDYGEIAPDGLIGDASLATADRGDDAYALAVDWISRVITRDFL